MKLIIDNQNENKNNRTYIVIEVSYDLSGDFQINSCMVEVSTEIPDKRSFTFIDQMSLNDVKKINLNDFVNKINKAVLVN